ncbi:nitrous oxide reductase family maturation protein NosD [Aneurinibacillus tyrosinisolvens]|uniref:nitrous oxide reductase family maturation protein NosD n=1 Tax=Aneurinibacillus tyrosinisolvens TaxID=1443435 RepID=UPI00069AC30A|nr:nitrous oxide reductase family maturation protein NosD [Aneurinibacillus tyrosinisolvens]
MKTLAALWMGLVVWLVGTTLVSAETSIQTLIDNTPENGVLTLASQVYNGNVVITKPLTIKGTGQTTIRGDGGGNVITVKAPNVRLENIAVENSSFSRSSAEEYAAIKLMADHTTVKNVRTSHSYHGISMKSSSNNVIDSVKITGIGDGEIAGQGNGIQLIHSQGNLLINNVISQTRDGIYFYYADQNKVENNQISGTRYGLHYMYSNDNTFSHNRFTKNTGGAALMVSKRIRLVGNEISFHQGTQAFGLLLQECEEVQVENNRFIQNQRGLYIDNAQHNRIAGNRFEHNQVGIELWASASEQVFTENHFFKNTAPVIATGVQASNKWSENRKGNDWGSDMPLLDLNQDGIGDNPIEYKSSLYKLIKENELIYLFLKSPAVSLYEKVNELMNRQGVMLEDHYPLVEKSGDFPLKWLVLFLLPAAGAVWYWQRRGNRG